MALEGKEVDDQHLQVPPSSQNNIFKKKNDGYDALSSNISEESPVINVQEFAWKRRSAPEPSQLREGLRGMMHGKHLPSYMSPGKCMICQYPY